MNKDEFGGACWKTLHALAGNATEAHQRAAFCRMVRALQECFPCDHCAEHLKMTLGAHKIEDYTQNAEELLKWTFIAHDAANIHYNRNNPNKIQKESPSWEEVRDMYLAIEDDEDDDQTIRLKQKTLSPKKKTPAFTGLKTLFKRR